MRKVFLVMAVLALLSLTAVTAFAADGWNTFVIRNSNTGNVAPVITDNSGGKLFAITLGGQKAGWGTNDINGKKIGDIQSISITRKNVTSAYGPYMNIWITDGSGGYACISNEPSKPGEWTGSSAYDTTWNVLKNATSCVYEVDSTIGFKLPNGITTKINVPAGTLNPHFTFNDFAGYTIATPTSNWGGTGAPDVLGASTYTAYGVNWVFGDTQINYLGGYLVSDPKVSAVPEPGTILAALSILGPAAMIFRRRKSA